MPTTDHHEMELILPMEHIYYTFIRFWGISLGQTTNWLCVHPRWISFANWIQNKPQNPPRLNDIIVIIIIMEIDESWWQNCMPSICWKVPRKISRFIFIMNSNFSFSRNEEATWEINLQIHLVWQGSRIKTVWRIKREVSHSTSHRISSPSSTTTAMMAKYHRTLESIRPEANQFQSKSVRA